MNTILLVIILIIVGWPFIEDVLIVALPVCMVVFVFVLIGKGTSAVWNWLTGNDREEKK